MVDEHQVEAWLRHVRLGLVVCGALSALGAVLVVIGAYPAEQPWVAPMLTVGVLLPAALRLPWRRLYRYPLARLAPYVLGLMEWAGITALAANDPQGPVFYPGAYTIVLLYACVGYSARVVAGYGALCVLGFVGLATATGLVDDGSTIGLAGTLLVLAILSVALAASRETRDADWRRDDKRALALVNHASDGVVVVDAAGRIHYQSPSMTRIFGYAPDELIGRSSLSLVHPDDVARTRAWFAQVSRSEPGTVARLDVRLRGGDGGWRHVELAGANQLHDRDLSGLVLNAHDVTARKALEEQLSHHTFHDPLTGLANRALFRNRVDHAIARGQRTGSSIALFLVDLDNFRLVNDGLGPGSGDQLLATVAQRLRDELRPSDTVARLGGDEFAVLVEDDVTELSAAGVAQRLVEAVRLPAVIDGQQIVASASVGVAILKIQGPDRPARSDADGLLRDADLAMYAAKAGGGNQYAIFDPAMHADLLAEARQRSELERALVEGQFVVHYQPIVELSSTRLVGVEALVRWNHPERGLIGPGAFIPLAEATGLVVPLGRWVLRQSCLQLARWRATFPQAANVYMSVNLSARQFQAPGLIDDVAAAIADTGIPAANLTLELTETLLMRDTAATVEALAALKTLGVKLAVDDFGTGYSALSYLRRFPVDVLKIDKSFVDGIVTNQEDAALARTIVELGRTLNLLTLAEGIESSAQSSQLETLGCTYGQGFLFARPTEPCEVEALLRRS
ncbi:EAL domain-containing protein [Planosporangium flavigriseum]|uniref:Two-component system response regulator n=1 Tax=Planosporangium flavigriseum TaxID=373681 RepID=A0A8J3PQA2_9ACTN|nr:two-component system response regulator [Planosporangium flavigriseum]